MTNSNRVAHGLVSDAYARGLLNDEEADRAHALVSDEDVRGLADLLLAAAARQGCVE